MINIKSFNASFLCIVISSLAVGCSGQNQEALSVFESDKSMPDKTMPKQLSLANINIWPKLDIAVKTDVEIEAKIAALLTTMTLEQKVAQMIQPEIRDITVEDMRKYGFGSYLNGGGAFPNNDKHATPADWVNLAEAMYQANGRIFRQDNELFTETSWLAVMHGQGLTPKGFHPLVDVLPEDEVARRLQHIHGVIQKSAETMPMQKDFIAKHCKAS